MSKNLVLIDFMSSVCWEREKREREVVESFFPGPEAGHTWLTVPAGSFMAIKCN
jgi:hypothetical protein